MNLRKKILLPVLMGAALIISAPVASAAPGDFGTNSGSADPAQVVGTDLSANQNIDVTVIVGDAIGLDCEDSVSLGSIVGFGQANGNVNCSVFTNNATGYEVSIGNMNVIALQSTQEGGNPIGSPATDTQKFLPDHTLMADPDSAAWAISSDGGTTWLSGAGSVVKTQATASAARGDGFVVTAGASAGSNANLEEGTYKGAFTLTATAI